MSSSDESFHVLGYGVLEDLADMILSMRVSEIGLYVDALWVICLVSRLAVEI